ncbi:MAG TPA: hypothetical protein VJQ82_16510, partial [Terriglobales bacterium]|nr:hypothetical protein [Terriglobales bacterium]
ANTYTITNPTAATGTVTGGGGTITYTYYRVTLSNPFGTTNGSANVIVTHANHGASAGDFVTISNATAVAGLTLNGEFQITSVSTNTYSITAPSNANATTTGGGSPQFQYDISGGPSDTVVGFGYGTGGYGGGGYGTMGSTGITFLARVWSLAHYGQQLLASPTGGTIYVWDPVIGGRAYPLYNAPAQVLAMFITPERFVVALGINGNAMQLAWADQNDYTVWTSTPTNTANTGRTLQSGAFFVGGIAARDGVILILSNTACISMTYTGDNNVYATQTVGDGSELAGPLAIAVIGGIAYWMGLSEFWTWNGSVTPLPSDDIRDYVFQNINLGQSQKFVAGSNRSKKEVFFFYCSASSNEIDRYVIYHIDQGCWSIGSLQRTSWADLGLLANPMATDASGFIYDHETGTDAAGSAMDSYVVLSPQDISKGAQIMEYFALYPDFERVVGDTTFSLLTQTYPMDAESIDGPYTIAPDGSTSRIDLRNSAKLIGFKLESNVVGGDWRLGLPRIEAQPGGARR